MTPKEKAIDLVSKFYSKTDQIGLLVNTYWTSAKYCALVAVDEIIVELESVEFNYNIKSSLPSEFWQEVKQEIEKL
jgi:hypothetical protein